MMTCHKSEKKHLKQKSLGLTLVEPFAAASAGGLAFMPMLSATSESVYPTERV